MLKNLDLQVQNEVLHLEVIRLREQLISLRFNGTTPGPAQRDLMNFLDSVADAIAGHPFAQTAPNYFTATLHRARREQG